MIGAVETSSPLWLSLGFPFPSRSWNSHSSIIFPRKSSDPTLPPLYLRQHFSLLPTLPISFSLKNHSTAHPHFTLQASSSSAPVGSAEYTEEPATNVKFQTSLTLRGCSSSLSLLGTGFREKVFAIIGIKVYAAGLYVKPSILKELNSWKGRSATEIQADSSIFISIFQSPSEKSLQIVLVRDVDGKTFWDALDEAISPRIKDPTPADISALSTFRGIFEGRPLKKGTFVFLTWTQPSKMLVSVSADGLPTGIGATIESKNVTSALFDVFFGATPVSSSLKASVAGGLATILN